MGRSSTSRERILEGACDALCENDCCCMTVDDICARARVQKGTFYHFFESKSALLAAALQHEWTTILEPAYERHFSRDNPPLERIKKFLDWVQQFQTEKHRRCGQVPRWPVSRFGCAVLNAEPAIRKKLYAIEVKQRGYFQSALQDAIEAKIIPRSNAVTQAMFLTATLEGILTRAHRLNELGELKALSALSLVSKLSTKTR